MSTDNNKKRIIYFDICKGLGILLVLIGHLQNDTIFSYSPYILSLCSWIFSFHMPLFFIISGMIIYLKKEDQKDLKETAGRKFRSIMIPYFWFSLIYILIVFYLLFVSKEIPLNTLFVQLWYVFGMYGMNVLWFLPALFASELIFLFITQRIKNSKSIIVIILLAIAAFSANYVRRFLPNDLTIYERLNELIITVLRPLIGSAYILTGFCIYKGLDILKEKVRYAQAVELILMPILLFINISLNRINRPVDFRSLVFNNPFLYYFCSLSGSLFIILLSRFLASLRIGNRINEDTAFPFIRFCGVNSLVFMAVHNNSAVLKLSMLAAMYINQFLTRARGYICYAVIIAIHLVYVSVTILLINRFLPFIAGRPMRKKG